VNGISIGSIVDYQVLPLDPKVKEIQAAYIRRVVDTLHDRPNVLWEAANESSGGGTVDAGFAEMLGQEGTPDWGDSTSWQYWVIDTIKQRESEMGYDSHPIGMTMQFPVADQTRALRERRGVDLTRLRRRGVRPYGGHPMAPDSPPSRWLVDPPPADGRKVVITDTDHYSPMYGDGLWAWKSFLRGHHPILMDMGLIGGPQPPDPTAGGPMSFEAFEPARRAMGDTARLAGRIPLIEMEPRTDVSSTGYALVAPGREYVVLQPEGPVVHRLRGARSLCGRMVRSRTPPVARWRADQGR
jgi:hypothetical protein